MASLLTNIASELMVPEADGEEQRDRDHRAVVVEVEIHPHPNADRLALARPVGTEIYVIVGKNQFKTGDLAVHIPVDSLIDEAFYQKYLAGSKIDIEKGRIRAARIRGVVSYGLVIQPEADWQLGQDVTEELRIKKYEPKTLPWWEASAKKDRARRNHLSKHKLRYEQALKKAFPEYTHIQNQLYYSDVLKEGEEVIITEKIHGTNFRAGRLWVRDLPRPWWVRLGRWFKRSILRKEPEQVTFVVGSHHAVKVIQDEVYWGAAKQAGLDKLGPEYDHFIFYGEVYGFGVQELAYGCAPGTPRKLAIFDIMFCQGGNRAYLNWDQVVEICKQLGLETVPVLYKGPWSKELRQRLAAGKSVLPGANHIREGYVVKPVQERTSNYCGRVIFKAISEEYLLSKTQKTEYH